MSQQQGNQGITPEHLRNLGNQVQGNDLAAPEPLANTEPDKSAQGTIEAKLKEAIVNYRIKCDMAVSERDDGFYTQKDYEKAINWELNRLLAIITTETKKARLDELQALLPETETGAVSIWVNKLIKTRLNALQKEQNE